jgi:hypothetical protein
MAFLETLTVEVAAEGRAHLGFRSNRRGVRAVADLSPNGFPPSFRQHVDQHAPEADGRLPLMLLHDSRCETRLNRSGDIVLLERSSCDCA